MRRAREQSAHTILSTVSRISSTSHIVKEHSHGFNATRQRAKRAHDLVHRIKDFIHESYCPKSTQMAWMVLSRAAGSALSYDDRLVPSKVLEREALEL